MNIYKKLKNDKPLLIFILLQITNVIILLNPTIYKQTFLKNFSYLTFKLNHKIFDIINVDKLKKENKNLINYNKTLNQKLINFLKSQKSFINDKYILDINLEENKNSIINTKNISDNLNKEQYVLINAKVINNTILKSKNYIIVNKGEKDGIQPNMGVISNDSIVGIVKFVSENFAVIISLLNIQMNTSVVLENSNILGSLKWNSLDSTKAQIIYIPKYAKIQKGQKIFTSGYNCIFPKNILIGEIIEYDKKENKLFYDINIDLKTNFSSLKNIYIIKNNFKNEIKKLEKKVQSFYK